VKINNITAGGGVDIANHGNIIGVGAGTSISGSSVTMDAISTGDDISSIGRADGSAMGLNTNSLGIRGDNAILDVAGDVLLNDIVSNNANITAGGNVTQTEGTQVDVSNLEIQAGGSIGSEDKPIVTNVDEITASGANVHLDNKSDNLTVHDITGSDVTINTAGNINTTPDGMITAHNLTIIAVYDIGTPDQPIRLTVDGNLILKSKRGGVYYVNFWKPVEINWAPEVIRKEAELPQSKWRLLYDPITQTKVLGEFAEDAKLEVTTAAHYAMMNHADLAACSCTELHQYNENCEAVDSADVLNVLVENAGSAAEKQIWQLIAGNKAIANFVLRIFSYSQPVCESWMYFEFNLAGLDSTYDGSLEGKTVYVLACVGGKIESAKAVVEDGRVHMDLGHLGKDKPDYGWTPFVIITEEEYNNLRNGNEL